MDNMILVLHKSLEYHSFEQKIPYSLKSLSLFDLSKHIAAYTEINKDYKIHKSEALKSKGKTKLNKQNINFLV